MNTERIANQIVRAADAMGLDATITGSGLSEAQYINTDFGKIRVATHDAKPTYENLHGEAVFTVGEAVSREGQVNRNIVTSDGDWLSCVAWLASKASVEIPGRHAKLIEKRDSAMAAYAAKLAELEAERKAANLEACDREQAAIAWARANRPDLIQRLEVDGAGVGKEFRSIRKHARKAIWKAYGSSQKGD